MKIQQKQTSKNNYIGDVLFKNPLSKTVHCSLFTKYFLFAQTYAIWMELFFLWGREGKKEWGRDLAFVSKREKICLTGGCLVVFLFTHQFTGQTACWRGVSSPCSFHPSACSRRRLRTAVLFQTQLCWEVSTPAAPHHVSPEATASLTLADWLH